MVNQPAKCSGVQPSSFVMFTFALYCVNIFTSSMALSITAWCKIVRPNLKNHKLFSIISLTFILLQIN